jgi:ubiquitin-conjugating enzyme E2 variant
MSPIAYIIAAVIVADLLTGLFHWLEDCYGLPTWPLIGESVIQPNIDHHVDPVVFTGGTYWSRNWQMIAFAAVIFAVVTVAIGFSPWFALVAVIAAHGNEVHVWNHRKVESNPAWINFLQDAGLVQSRVQHNRHHKPPFTAAYCTILSFNNAWLDRVEAWAHLEAAIEIAFGIPPKRGTDERSGV